MRKLAFEHAGNGAFEMPKFRMVQLEKENNNVVFAKPKTVYKGSGFSYSRSEVLRAALQAEEVNTSTSSTYTVTADV
ncbi:MAG: hypothetical protein IJB80_03525 [Clostridia bacterium]|nr:hypothetical protein [Clostridia bacterium]